MCTSSIDIVQNKDGLFLFRNLIMGFGTVFIENLQYTNVQMQMYPVGTLTSSTWCQVCPSVKAWCK